MKSTITERKSSVNGISGKRAGQRKDSVNWTTEQQKNPNQKH